MKEPEMGVMMGIGYRVWMEYGVILHSMFI